MPNFTDQRRQQFLTEEYYQNAYNFYVEDIEFWKESDAFEDDEYNSGEERRWSLIINDYLFLIYLNYTAGNAIEGLNYFFEKAIEGYENQANALGRFKKSKKPAVIGGDGGFIALTTISLAVLLHKNNLLFKIKQLINGEDGGTFSEDEIINKFLKLTDLNHPNTKRDGIYSYNFSILCDVIDNVLIKDNKILAIEMLDEYLTDWYQMNKHKIWYNSHLESEEELKYSGYWSFEAAALVYLLDLDDSSLHKYLYYPKDIVEWIREKKIQENNQPILEVVRQQILAGQKVPKSGYWFTTAKEKSRQYFNQSDIFPDFESDWGDVYWYFDGEE